ncbi:MAG: bifunctional metallophosphatase/5'-nucleotidase [Methanomassiliicoccales archaeon]|nr:bifunctional metallophosphatase/5'-nucleotidase [Methanomassiliicoccales archaeon]
MTDKKLTIFQMNDSHAYIEEHNEFFWHGDKAEYHTVGGFSRIGHLIKEAKDERPDSVLALDCGDTIHGTYPAVTTQGEAVVPILNAMEFDAMTAHWEFAYGPKQLKKLSQKLDFPVLGINCYDRKTRRPFLDPYIVKEMDGLNVAIVGLASNIVDKTMPSSFSEGLRFTLGRFELPSIIGRLRKESKADLVILISHLGFPQDMMIAEEVVGIDVLLSGHTHNRLSHPVKVKDTIIIQSGCHGSFLGRLDVNIERGRIRSYDHSLITITPDIPQDEQVEGLVQDAVGPCKDLISEEVGHCTTTLNRNTVLEATMDNLLLQAIREAAGTQLAFSNGWRYGSPVPPGKITLNDLWNIVPTNPSVSTVDLSGKDIWDLMEDSLDRTFARNPFDQQGGYVKRCIGLNIYFKVENPRGHRIQDIFVEGEHMDLNRSYSAAFMTTQGIPLGYGMRRIDLGVSAIDALKGYLSSRDAVSAELTGTVVAV